MSNESALSPIQQVFRKIVLHNKLLDETQLDARLAKRANPEHVIRDMVFDGIIKGDVGKQLLKLYYKKIEQLSPEELGDSAPTASSATGDSQVGKAGEGSKSASVEQAQPRSERAADKAASESAIKAKSSAAPRPAPANYVGEGTRDLIHELLQAARDANASDIHITAGLPPQIRVAAELRPLDYPALSPEQTESALLSLLKENQREHFLKHRDIDFCYEGPGDLGRFRTNFLQENSGMDGIFRLISNKVPSFEELKLPELVKKFTDYRVGIVLVTGPKSCGKTTTLAAMVDYVNANRREHIITVEDPIEYVHPCKKSHISQREVGAHTREFPNALRAALREAPDVIMVGEMRDLETTSLAITAAETGHLVLATLHTPDATRTIGRVLDVFPPKEQGQIRAMLSESLRGVISQQLIPSMDGKHLELATEILVNTPAIANMIREDRTFQLRGVMQTGRKLGMVLMDDSLIALAKAGKINSEDAALRATDEPYVRRELGLKPKDGDAVG